jgi:hypothetical protein
MVELLLCQEIMSYIQLNFFESFPFTSERFLGYLFLFTCYVKGKRKSIFYNYLVSCAPPQALSYFTDPIYARTPQTTELTRAEIIMT